MHTYDQKESGIRAFEIHEKHFDVKYKDSEKIYTYHRDNIGQLHFDIMIELAWCGYGLCSYIAKHIRGK